MKKKCNICNKTSAVLVREIQGPYYDMLFSLYQCNECYSRFFDLDEHPEIQLDKFYEKIAEKSGLNIQFKIDKYWLNELKTIQQIYQGKPKSILDIGCRTGDFLLHWPNNITKIGIEVSNYSASIARERGLSIKQEFLENSNFKIKFDLVSAYAILEHLAKPQEFLSKIPQLLNEEGIFVLMIPSYETFKAKFLEFFNTRWHMYNPPNHLCFYSREYIDSFLAKQGFVLVKRKYTSGGMFNPFVKIPVLSSIFARLIWTVDNSILNKCNVFDHMYSYYKYKPSN